MATEENLDEIDIKILKLLQQNSRLTVKELAARVNPLLLQPLNGRSDWSVRDTSSDMER